MNSHRLLFISSAVSSVSQRSRSHDKCFGARTFDDCCDTAKFGPTGNVECWSEDEEAGFEECCWPEAAAALHETCDWGAVRSRVLERLGSEPSPGRNYLEKWEWLMPEEQLRILDMCCSFYDNDDCWPPAPAETYHHDMHPWYLQCCFPRLRQMLQLTTDTGRSSAALTWAQTAATSALRDDDSSENAAISDMNSESCDQFEERCGTIRLHRFCRFRVFTDGSVQSCNLTREVGLTNGYWESIYRALLILSFHTTLTPVDFFVSKVDVEFTHWPVPVAAQARLAGTGVTLLPHEYALTRWNRVLARRLETAASVRPWSSRQPRLFWRGSTTADLELTMLEDDPEDVLHQFWVNTCNQCKYHMEHDFIEYNITRWSAKNWHLHPRGRLVLLGSFAPELIDACFTKIIWWMADEDQTYLKQQFRRRGWLTDEGVEYEEHTKYRYMISTDYSDRIYWMWLSGALVFVVHSPIQHWVVPPYSGGLIQEYVHYIPVKQDLSDLLEKLQWARDHDDQAEAIARNGQALAQRAFSHDDVLFTFYELLSAWKGAQMAAVASEHRNTR